MPATSRLADAPVGARVVLVAADHEPAHLAHFGLRPGCRLVVLARTAGGGRVVGIGPARVAVGRALSARLHVAEVAG